MSRWADFRNRLVKWLLGVAGLNGAKPAEAAEKEPAVSATVPKAAAWADCVKASCWNGKNASTRYMNALSPAMSDGKFRSYIEAQKNLGCDHCHLFLVNKGDGECAGYRCDDAATAKTALSRLAYIREQGLGIVLWLVADDSPAWAKEIFADPGKSIGKFSDAGLLDYASCVVLGLEMDEYGSASDWKKVADALSKRYGGPVGVHHTAGKRTYAALGSVVFDQLDPSCTVADIKRSVREIIASGREAFGFEYRRGPDRAAAQAALDAGAHGCGNWKE